MKTKRIIAAALAGALILCAGCGKEEELEEEAPVGTAVEVTPALAGPMSAQSVLTGKVAAVNEVQVFPMLAGQVLTLPVKEGGKVNKGQVLFTVDTSNVTSSLSALQQSYAATQQATNLAIQSARISIDQAQTAVDNTQALYEAGAAAEQDLTKAKQALEQATAGLNQAQAQQKASLAQIQAQIDQINKQAQNGTVVSPCAGLITSVNVVRGGMASSAQPAVVIAEDSKVEVKVSVAEDVFTNIKAGDEVDLAIASTEQKTAKGKIASVPAAANVQTSLYDVSISLPSGVTPPIGAFATVTFYTNRRDNTIQIPTEAILTGTDGQFVYIVQDDGEGGKSAMRLPVETGLVGESLTEIVSGLEPDDLVVTKGQSYLSDGAAVRVVSDDDTAGEESPAASQDDGGEG
ncbi:efflux RND transporter periplasmic adaptor subunit [Butyricicoccus faecihominis]|uniref:efflux RND transporter periplasmic adaptor subunit n=1 Tax=Butyricicoccus faecihominis TaxID=1712515 RepID=UPI0024793370|nr:efflux RND transporter periplasmic adaptor subunit [Butyricicoccus faecihominis]MCQ5130003.1 efflux RND transporter periplasmic adaptor subunit [Butyricicoccus faecihominis]